MASYSASPDPVEDALSGNEELLRRFKSWFRADSEHSSDWRKEAKEDYDFVAGHQWDQKDIDALKEQMRPVITFNRIDPLIRSVAGEQINAGQETRYLPREMGDAKANELLTEAARWFRDQCDADDEESDMFWDSSVSGMGWTDTRLEMDEDPDEPLPVVERMDPMEMYWDCDARKRNLADARRVWRVRDIPVSTARDMFPDAADSDMDATWASTAAAEGVKAKGNDRDEYSGENQSDDPTRKDDDATVTIVQVQWVDQETFYKVELPQVPTVDPMTGQPMNPPPQVEEMSEADYKKLGKKLKAVGAKVAKLTRKSYRKAFIGKKVLKEGPLKCPHFTFQCVTGFRDKNKGTWYGLVRSMKDPQRWANKWLSQTLHQMNASAKGGVMMEEGAVEDQREFEKSWARTEAVTMVPAGTLAGPMGPKILPKPVSPFPVGFVNMTEFAISSIRDVAGINLEMLGMREADQPASLEWQRRQAGITILAQLFRSMRRYHRTQGKVMLYYIQNHLSPQTLVRIIGDGEVQGAGGQPIEQGKPGYVPMQAVLAMKGADVKYDIVVDEGPTSPNQKERVWGMIGEKFWELPSGIQTVLLDYSPFPESVVSKVKEAAAAASQGPEAQMAQRLQAAEAALKEAQAAKAHAEALAKEHDKQIEIQAERVRLEMELQKMQLEARIAQQEVESRAAIEKLQAGADIASQEHKLNAELALAEKKFDFDRRLKLLDAQIKQSQAAQQQEVAAKGAAAKPEAKANGSDNQMAAAMHAIAAAMSRPRAIVRGKDGRAEGID